MELTSNSRHLRTLTRKRPTSTSLGDEDPFNREYQKLSEGHLHGCDVQAPSAAVVTDIEGGKPHSIHGVEPVDFATEEDDFAERPAIMETVKVEQSRKAAV